MIKPTIGRVVHFWAHKATDIPQPLAAIITWVHSDTEVNLAVFQANGVASTAIGVPLWQKEGTHPQLPYCEWMDYQIGQAKAAKEPKDPPAA